MKRVLFFIHNGWVFGKIHNELIKLLLPEFYCDILCWTHAYTQHEMELLAQKYDLFVSTPEGCFSLHTQHGVPYEKLAGVAHLDWDIYHPIEKQPESAAFDKLAGFSVICPLLINISLSHGITRIPKLTPIGLYQKFYARPMSQSVTRLGYFGRMVREDRTGMDIKRGALAQTVAEQAGLEFVQCESVNFLAAERLYKNVDLVMFCSLMEGNPYPALEAFASGIPVLGTATGLFPALAASGGGAVLPFESDKFVPEAVEVIQALKADHALYAKMHTAALNKSREFDWQALKQTWVDFLNGCLAT